MTATTPSPDSTRLPPATSATGRGHQWRRRLRALAWAAACGAATATGTGLVGLLFWWITHH